MAKRTTRKKSRRKKSPGRITQRERREISQAVENYKKRAKDQGRKVTPTQLSRVRRNMEQTAKRR